MSPLNWKQASEAPVEEQTGFEDLPAGAWVIGATATTQNGGAAPSVRKKKFKDDNGNTREYYAFNVGLLVKGGDTVLDPDRHKDRYTFFSAPVHPRDDDDAPSGPKGLMSGRLTGFLNAIFAQGVALDEKDKKERAQKRWQVTLQKLTEVEKLHPEMDAGAVMNDITGQPDLALGLLSLAIAAIENDSKPILFKTGLSKKRPGSEQRTEIKQFEDYAPKNVADRKVKMFDQVGVVTAPAAAMPSFD